MFREFEGVESLLLPGMGSRGWNGTGKKIHLSFLEQPEKNSTATVS